MPKFWLLFCLNGRLFNKRLFVGKLQLLLWAAIIAQILQHLVMPVLSSKHERVSVPRAAMLVRVPQHF